MSFVDAKKNMTEDIPGKGLFERGKKRNPEGKRWTSDVFVVGERSRGAFQLVPLILFAGPKQGWGLEKLAFGC